MFEVGKDIVNHDSLSGSCDADTKVRLKIVYFVFLALFVAFGLRTLGLCIQGADRTRL